MQLRVSFAPSMMGFMGSRSKKPFEVSNVQNELANNTFVPTRKGEAPLLAAQRGR